MAYTTAHGVSDVTAQSYADTTLVQVKADALLRSAERVVARVAPPPDPKTAEYNAAAADTELKLFEALAQTPVRDVRSESVGDISVSYGDKAMTVDEIAAQEMSEWAVSIGGSNTAYFGPVPW